MVSYLDKLTLVVILRLFLALFSSFSNALIVTVAIQNSKLRTISNSYIINITIAHLCIALQALITNTATLFDSRVLADTKIFCDITGFLNHLFMVVSIVTIAILTLDRLKFIDRPVDYHYKLRWKLAGFLIGFSWIYGIIMCTFPFLFNIGFTFDLSIGECGVNWNSQNIWISATLILLFYFLPTAFTVLTYARLFGLVHRRMRQVQVLDVIRTYSQEYRNRNRQLIHKAYLKTAKILFLIVLVYILATLPQILHTCVIITDADPFNDPIQAVTAASYELLTAVSNETLTAGVPGDNSKQTSSTQILNFSFSCLILLNTGIQPWIYGMHNRKFRQLINHLLPWRNQCACDSRTKIGSDLELHTSCTQTSRSVSMLVLNEIHQDIPMSNFDPSRGAGIKRGVSVRTTTNLELEVEHSDWQ